ncbi:MAG: glycoside hydrolase family 130 protein [Verrucomicrobiia bacterium]
MLTRHSASPVLVAGQVPYPADCVFNAGVAKLDDGYVMLFRNDFGYQRGKGFAGTNLGLARSRDGIKWEVEPEPVITQEKIRQAWRHRFPERLGDGEIRRVYDPRVTVVDGEILVTLAVDTRHGILGAVTRTGPDFRDYELLSLSTPDNRNMVLFPEKIGGRFWRLERPFPVYGRYAEEAFEIWGSASPDLVHWGETRLVLGSEEVPYANSKIGPAAPPLKTDRGWLTTIHAVWKDNQKPLQAWDEVWTKTYFAGLILLDLANPLEVIGMLREPLLQPEAEYEVSGFRGGVIFPCGLLREGEDEIRMYYGAADTVIGLATGSLEEILAAMTTDTKGSDINFAR